MEGWDRFEGRERIGGKERVDRFEGREVENRGKDGRVG